MDKPRLAQLADRIASPFLLGVMLRRRGAAAGGGPPDPATRWASPSRC